MIFDEEIIVNGSSSRSWKNIDVSIKISFKVDRNYAVKIGFLISDSVNIFDSEYSDDLYDVNEFVIVDFIAFLRCALSDDETVINKINTINNYDYKSQIIYNYRIDFADINWQIANLTRKKIEDSMRYLEISKYYNDNIKYIFLFIKKEDVYKIQERIEKFLIFVEKLKEHGPEQT